MARPAGFEPTTPWFVAKYSIQLSYGRNDSSVANGCRPCRRAPRRAADRMRWPGAVQPSVAAWTVRFARWARHWSSAEQRSCCVGHLKQRESRKRCIHFKIVRAPLCQGPVLSKATRLHVSSDLCSPRCTCPKATRRSSRSGAGFKSPNRGCSQSLQASRGMLKLARRCNAALIRKRPEPALDGLSHRASLVRAAGRSVTRSAA